MNQEELDHFYSYYSSPFHQLFTECLELTRASNLRLFHDTNKYSSYLFFWLTEYIQFKGEENSEEEPVIEEEIVVETEETSAENEEIEEKEELAVEEETTEEVQE